ncbi:putative methyltransferase YcgJ [BD1-7 clade bacterium]|uniref:Putative methyltransferase YcgJ n=1 Tax=BD1-7 clade bacterium TaxID=2029982 RepID=A0A5S9NKI9_9GAMM|nr:putative methyltransferase YcgJ [BD1-7 clade bacterium]CAA0093116.1 putative methyltransferase YcgJ [BD1-7 clade bacterium]
MDKNPSNYSAVDNSENPTHWIELMLDFPAIAPEVSAIRQQLLDWLVLAVDGSDSHMTILDAGCGPGVTTQAIADRVDDNVEIIGADLSQSMVDYASAHSTHQNVRYHKACLKDLPYSDGSIDVIRVERCLHHVSGVSQAFKEFERVLKPGGRLVINEPDVRYICMHPLQPAVNVRYAAAYDAPIANGAVGAYLPEYLNANGFDLLEHQPHLLMMKSADAIDRCFNALEVFRDLCKKDQNPANLSKVEDAIDGKSFYLTMPCYSVMGQKHA